MKIRKSLIVLALLVLFTALYGFIQENPYFSISKKDVELKIPIGFPQPLYDLKKNKITPAGFILGRKLFYDPILSKDYFTSCASCHQRFAAFAHIKSWHARAIWKTECSGFTKSDLERCLHGGWWNQSPRSPASCASYQPD